MSLGGAFNLLFSPSESRNATNGVSAFTDFGSFFGFSGGDKMKPVHYKQSLQIAAVHNAVDQISNDVAKIPFSVFIKKADGNRERAVNHAADRLISVSPNTYMTSFVWRKMMAVSVLLRGNGLSIIVFNAAGYPEALIPVNWDDVTDIKLKDGELLYYIRGYKEPFLSSEVLHFKDLSINGIVGISRISYGCMQMNIAIQLTEYSATNLEHKGVSRGVIEAEKATNSDAKKLIIAGVKNALGEKSPDRVAVLDEGMKWKSITITPEEAQIIEQMQFSVEEIARFFNIAPHKIKSLKQSTNNNIEQQSLDHVSDTIQPFVTNIEQEMAKKLLTDRDAKNMYIKGNINVLLRADSKSRADYYAKAVFFGWKNRNEVRELEDDSRGPAFLDEFLTPANTLTEQQLQEIFNSKKDE